MATSRGHQVVYSLLAVGDVLVGGLLLGLPLALLVRARWARLGAAAPRDVGARPPGLGGGRRGRARPALGVEAEGHRSRVASLLRSRTCWLATPDIHARASVKLANWNANERSGAAARRSLCVVCL